MVYVPLALGAWVGGANLAKLGLLVAATTMLFFARQALLELWLARRRRLSARPLWLAVAAYTAGAFLCGVALVLGSGLYGLVPLALGALALMFISLYAFAKGEYRHLAHELLGVAGLTLTAPAAHYTGTGYWTAQALWLWVWCTLFFWSSVFHVRYRVLNAHQKNPAVRLVRHLSIAYHTLLSVVIGLSWWERHLPALAAAAFLPILSRAAWALLAQPRQVALKRVGVLEAIYSLIFLTGIGLALA